MYALWQSPVVLLILQGLGIGLAGWPIYRLARHLGYADWLAALWLMPFYGYFGYWTALEYPFHVATLAVLPLSWALYFLITRQDRALVIALIIASLTKEDMPLVAVMIGVYLIVLRRQWKLGLALIIAGAAYTLAVIKWWIPWVSHIKYPFDRLQITWSGAKTSSLGFMMTSFGWLPLGAVEVLILVAPLWVSRFFSNMPARWGVPQHYAANQGPILAVAALVASVRICHWLSRRYHWTLDRIWAFQIMSLALATGGTLVVWAAPEHRSAWPARAWLHLNPNPTMQTAQSAFVKIPAAASVGVQSAFPQLTSRRDAWLLPIDLTKSHPDYLLLSNTLDSWPFADSQAVNAYISQAEGMGYVKVINHDGITLLRRR